MPSTRDRIIVATNELFRRQGYNGTSLSQISKASGATIGSIYHFFPGGKEALAVAVVDATGEVYRELFESIVAEAETRRPRTSTSSPVPPPYSRRAASSIRAPSERSLARSPTPANHSARQPRAPSNPGWMPHERI